MQYYLLLLCVLFAFVLEFTEAQWGYGYPYGGYGGYGGGYGGGMYGGYGGGWGYRRRMMMGMYNPYMMYGK